MSSTFEVVEILVLAAIAGFIIMKLRSTLGKRTGHENPRPDPFSREPQPPMGGRDQDDGDDRVVPMPGREDMAAASSTPGDFGKIAAPGTPLAQALTEIQIADRSFDPAGFLGGARQAYEMIVTAFNAGDRGALRPLLSEDVYGDFDAAITAREREEQTIDFTFVGLKKAEVTDATLSDRIAEVTVKFVSEIISVTKNADGAVIQGDPTTVRPVTDEWTFARDTSIADPNWHLVATAG